jgi:hypothetical protein
MNVSMKFKVFWNVPPCSLVTVDRRYRGAYCLHHQDDESWCMRQYAPLKRQSALMRLHGVATQKTVNSPPWEPEISRISSSLSSSLAWQPFMDHSFPWISWQQNFLRSLAVNPTPKPEPGGPGLRVATPPPRRQGNPAVPPGTGYPFQSPFYYTHELRWDCSYPPVTTWRSEDAKGKRSPIQVLTTVSIP